MKRLGLIGGTSWVSTLYYYRFLNQSINRRLGGHHSAEIVLRSFDFQPLINAVADQEALERVFDEAADELAGVGAELLAVASVTGHKFAGPLEARDDATLVHVAEATRQALLDSGARRVGIIGTSLTMRDASLTERLVPCERVEVVLPPSEAHPDIDGVIFGDLMRMRLGEGSRSFLEKLTEDFMERGVDSLLLACTELAFAFERMESALSVYDATELHCEALADAALTP
jgi:aspartate racemase